MKKLFYKIAKLGKSKNSQTFSLNVHTTISMVPITKSVYRVYLHMRLCFTSKCVRGWHYLHSCAWVSRHACKNPISKRRYAKSVKCIWVSVNVSTYLPMLERAISQTSVSRQVRLNCESIFYKRGCFKKWANAGLFFVYFVFSNKQIYVKNVHPKWVLGFEPTTFRT